MSERAFLVMLMGWGFSRRWRAKGVRGKGEPGASRAYLSIMHDARVEEDGHDEGRVAGGRSGARTAPVSGPGCAGAAPGAWYWYPWERLRLRVDVNGYAQQPRYVGDERYMRTCGEGVPYT